MSESPTGISLGRVTTILLVSRGLGYVLAVVNSIVLARTLGVQGLGEYIYATGLAALFSLLTQMGIGTVVTRSVAQEPEKSGELLHTALKVQAILALSMLIVIPLFAAALPDQPVPLLYIGIAATQVAIGALSWPYLAVIGGRARYDKLAGAELIGGFVTTGSLLLLALWGGEVLAFLLIQVFSAVCAVGAARWMAKPFITEGQGTLPMRTLLRKAVPFGAAAAIQGMYLRLDVLLLGQMSNTVTVGLYNVAYKPITLAISFGGTVAGTLLPVLAQHKHEEMPVSFQRAVRGLGAAAPGVALVLTGMAEPIIVFMYGLEFQQASSVLVILAWAIVFNWLYAPLGMALQACGYERLWLGVLVIGLVLNMGANIWAIPQWGPAGAAGATLVSEMVVLGVGGLIFFKTFTTTVPWKSIVIGFTATLAGVAVLQALSVWGPLPATLASIMVFASLLFILRLLTKDDVVTAGGWFRQAIGVWARS